jgi:hypothetical protein
MCALPGRETAQIRQALLGHHDRDVVLGMVDVLSHRHNGRNAALLRR